MSGLYKSYKKGDLEAVFNILTVDVRAILGDVADYTVDLALHDFLDDIPAAAREETSAALGSKTSDSPEGGVFDAANVTWTGASGDPCEFISLHNQTPGTDATRNLIVYIDGFSVILNGGDITANWDNGANRIFKL